MSPVRGLGALTRAYLLETWRSKPAIFWNLVFPLLTLIGFSYLFGAGEKTRVARVVPGILTINLIAAAFFGVSLHMVSLRENGHYRRLWVTPITSLTVVLAHAVTALVNIAISCSLQLATARALFGVEIRGSVGQLAAACLLAAFALVPLGLLVGSIARDMRTAPAISNLLFFPLAFLSGAALPLYLMPAWMQRLATLLPTTYVVELLQGAFLRGGEGKAVSFPAGILMLTGILGFAWNALLFRWESQARINRRGLALAAASLAAIYGTALAAGPKLEATRAPDDHGTGSSTRPLGAGARVLTGMTILDGQGGRIDRGEVILEGNRIALVGVAGETLAKGVSVTDFSGMYMIPGLIESHNHLGGSAGGSVSSDEFVPSRLVHDLQVYLALGITSFVSMTDHVEDLERLRAEVASGAMRAPRPYLSGPGITARGGHPAKIFSFLPGLPEYMTRQVASPAEAEQAVRELAARKVDIIKLYLEGGSIGQSFPVLSEAALRAALRTAEELDLPNTVHVDGDRHARLAIEAGARSLEHVPPDLSEGTINAMVVRGVTLTPTLAASEAMARIMNGAPITEKLVLQWVDPVVLSSLPSPESWIARVRRTAGAVAYHNRRDEQARSALRRAVAAQVTILAGSDAGNAGSFHGPGLLRELELLVEEGGMSPAAAIISATGAAARRLGKEDIGRIAPGAFGDVVVLGADPEKNIRALRDIRAVYFGGEPLKRESLLSTHPGNWRALFSFPTPAPDPAPAR